MHFQIEHYADAGDPEVQVAPVSWFTWKLVDVEDNVLLRAPRTFDTEKEARSQIAAAKRTMRAASCFKVVSPPDD